MQTSKAIKVFDENGDEFSKKLEQLCHQNGWEQSVHLILISQGENEEGDDASKDEFADQFEKNVRSIALIL